MFTPRLLKIIDEITKIVHIFGVFPAKYDKKKRMFYYHLTYRTIFNSIYYFLVFLFWVYRTIAAKQLGSKKDFHTCCVFVVTGIIGMGTWIIFLFNAKKCASTVNTFLRWGWQFQEAWMPNWNYTTALTGRFLEDTCCLMGIIFMLFTPFLLLIYHLLFPEASIFFYSLLPADYQNRYFLFLSIISLEIHGFIFLSTLTCLGIIVSSYLCSMVPLVKKEFRVNGSNYTTSNRLRKPNNLMLAYRSLEVMHGIGIDLFGILILPAYTAVGQFILFCNVSGLRSGSIDLILLLFSLVAQFCMFVILEFFGKFNKNACLTIQSWKYLSCSQFEKKCLNKFSRSCIPLKAETKGYFVIRRLTVIKFLRAVIRGTFRALMTLDDTRLHNRSF